MVYFNNGDLYHRKGNLLTLKLQSQIEKINFQLFSKSLFLTCNLPFFIRVKILYDGIFKTTMDLVCGR